MKKKIMFIVLVMSTGFIMAGKGNDESTFALQPYTICLGDEGHNSGLCKSRVDGLGSSCVEAGFLQSKNCYGQMNKPEN